jgi:ATP-dependent Clp protease ATP-binding subunit ClpC
VHQEDGALERRFQKVMIEPTTTEETLEILRSVKYKYEEHHHVHFSDSTLVSAVNLSERYITDKNFPDKAIDVLDETGSRVHIANIVVPKEILDLESEIEKIRSQKESFAKMQDFERAAKLRDMERSLVEKLDLAREEWEKEEETRIAEVLVDDISEVVSMMTGIPTKRIAESESKKLLKMNEALKEKIIGQNNAIETISKAIRRTRAGLKDPNKPIGSFLFLGPTGVGKTHFAKTLAEYLFESQNALIRVDMSEYMEKFNVSRLVGSPPGYVGYEEGGLLTEKVRRRPYSVILLDEIEKAHPDIFNLLLQVFDEGHLTDSLGRRVDFKNTILIMTSNIGAREIKKDMSYGFSSDEDKDKVKKMKNKVTDELKRLFNPEFLNRLDDTIYFNSLEINEAVKIVQLVLQEMSQKVADRNMQFVLTEGAKKFIAEKGFDPVSGARPLKRAIQKYIEDPIADEILKGKFSEGSIIQIKMKNKTELGFFEIGTMKDKPKDIQVDDK